MNHSRCTNVSNLPWNLPAPFKRLDYLAQYPEHEELGVCVDLAAIQPFEVREQELDPDSVMWTDLQVGPGENTVSRLGSGRAGFFGGKYLKGVGRTQLAGNWADHRDTSHGTGHMLPSAAVRERIATVYMEAKSAQHLIVPCEGILIRRAEPALVDGLRVFQEKMECEMAPVDRAMQALSVKPADFARFSNVNWLLGSCGPSFEYIVTAAALFKSYSEDPSQPASKLGSCSATSIARALASALTRGVDAFREYFRLGIHWGSYYNNFTLDGRFLDLEVPIVHGEPFIGCFANHHSPTIDRDPSKDQFAIHGVELFEYALHVVRCIDSIRDRFRLYQSATQDQILSRFLLELEEAMETEVGAEHPLRSRDYLIGEVLDLLEEAGADRGRVRPYVEAEYREAFEGVVQKTPRLSLRRRAGRTARPEPMLFSSIYEADELYRAPRDRGVNPDAELVQGILERLDACEDPEELLAELSMAEEELRSHVQPNSRLQREPRAMRRGA